MKKLPFALLIMLLVLGMVCCASAETNLNLDDIGVSCTIPDGYVVMTRSDLDKHQEWLGNHGYTTESKLEAMKAENVYAEAWLPNDDAVRIAVSAVTDQFARQYFDLDQQTSTERAAFRKAHLNGTGDYGGGYTYNYAEWKNMDNCGRVLQLEYKQTSGDVTYRGYARRAVRNGYTITVDYRVEGRRTNTADSKVINNIVKTLNFTAAKVPGTVVKAAAPSGESSQGENPEMSFTGAAESVTAPIAISTYPVEETNTGKIKVAGVCDPNRQVIATFMCMSSADPVSQETVSDSKGKFSFSQTLPKEGVWLTTLTVQSGDTILDEAVLNTTTYRASLLPINFDTPSDMKLYESVPANADVQALISDTTVISGSTVSGVSIQFFVNGVQKKEVTTNNNGTFSFKFDSSENGTYDVTLVFAKKKMSTRRYTGSALRTLTEEDIARQARDEAVKPSYSTLKSKLEKYTGRVLTYTLYVEDINSNGNDFVYTMALTKSKSGAYGSRIVLTADRDLGFGTGEQHKVYGTCTGEYEIQSDEGTEKLPSMSLIFVDD